jgi:hypothetical protein
MDAVEAILAENAVNVEVPMEAVGVEDAVGESRVLQSVRPRAGMGILEVMSRVEGAAGTRGVERAHGVDCRDIDAVSEDLSARAEGEYRDMILVTSDDGTFCSTCCKKTEGSGEPNSTDLKAASGDPVDSAADEYRRSVLSLSGPPTFSSSFGQDIEESGWRDSEAVPEFLVALAGGEHWGVVVSLSPSSTLVVTGPSC